ncbi:potassium channel SKOR-like protein [Tanacetum coccineum]
MSPYDSSHTDSAVFQDLPGSCHATVTENIYKPHIAKVSKAHEEFVSPGKVLTEQGSMVDHLYFICDGKLDEIVVYEGGTNESVSILTPHDSFGDVSILCNIPRPYTMRVFERSLLLRIDMQSFTNILKIYFHDKGKILNNLLKVNHEGEKTKKLKIIVETSFAQGPTTTAEPSTSTQQQNNVLEEADSDEDVDTGYGDTGEKEWVYDNELYSDLEEGEIQPEGPSVTFIEDSEKLAQIIGAIYAMLLAFLPGVNGINNMAASLMEEVNIYTLRLKVLPLSNAAVTTVHKQILRVYVLLL